MFKKIAKWFAAAASIVGAATVEAASVVPAATTTQLSTDGVDTITAVGGAILLVAVVAVLFKWAKASIFG
jgi:hypothetical protein